MGAALSRRSLIVLVIDASAAIAACLTVTGWDLFGEEELFAPPLLFSEASSALHEAQWRGDLPLDEARAAMERLGRAPLAVRDLDDRMEAWEIADRLGWAKTYDAEYVALARTLGCRLVTLDTRLRRSVRDLVEVIGPADL